MPIVYSSRKIKQKGTATTFDDAQKSSVSWSSTDMLMGVPEEQKRRTKQRALMGCRLKTFWRLSQWWKNLQELKNARVKENSRTSKKLGFAVYILVDSWPESLDMGRISL